MDENIIDEIRTSNRLEILWESLRLGLNAHLEKYSKEHDVQIVDSLHESYPTLDKEQIRALVAKVRHGIVVPPREVEVESFWRAHPMLTHIERVSRAKRASPWAVLAVTMARVLCETHPRVVLPNTVGGHGSLNMFVALVGPSGSGKGRALSVSRDAIRIEGERVVYPLGSGEGISSRFMSPGTQANPATQMEWRALFQVEEIGTLAALIGRTGATLMAELRKAWSGEALGFANRQAVIVPAHKYRMCLAVGVQPGASQTLLSKAETAVGTGQRFLWMDVVDRDAPDVAPSCPGVKLWERPGWSTDNFGGEGVLHLGASSDLPVDLPGWAVMGLPNVALAEIDQAALDSVRGKRSALDGHLLLSQAKVAAALALLLDGSQDITEGHWLLAGQVIDHSNGVRDRLIAEYKATEHRRRTERGKAEADVALAREQAIDMSKRAKVADKLQRKFRGEDNVRWVDMTRATTSGLREALDGAVSDLISIGAVTELEDTGGGRRFKFH